MLQHSGAGTFPSALKIDDTTADAICLLTCPP